MRSTMSWILRSLGFAGSALALAACVHSGPPVEVSKAGLLCETDMISISTGFTGAGQHGCALSATGPVLTVWPEASIAGPINPSPWYAFEADIRSSEPVGVRLDYASYWHRYQPWISRDEGETWQKLPEDSVDVGEDGHIATLVLPGGTGPLLVAGHPLVTPADMRTWSRAMADRFGMERVSYGKSLDGRDLQALVAGAEAANRIVIVLTGQHPPEQTGAEAFKVFSETLMERLQSDTLADTRIVMLPMVNPDGRARGHWRHNHGGLDLNRDWRNRTQPETQAAAAFLASEAEGRQAVAFLDFHSTWETLVYTQPFEEAYADMRFPRDLKQAFDDALEPDPEWISGHNAESGTSKNWALQTLDVAGLTIELADAASQAEIRMVGEVAADTLFAALQDPQYGTVPGDQ